MSRLSLSLLSFLAEFTFHPLDNTHFLAFSFIQLDTLSLALITLTIANNSSKIVMIAHPQSVLSPSPLPANPLFPNPKTNPPKAQNQESVRPLSLSLPPFSKTHSDHLVRMG